MWRVGLEKKARDVFTQPLCLAGLSVCPTGSVSARGPFHVLEDGCQDRMGLTCEVEGDDLWCSKQRSVMAGEKGPGQERT